MVVAAKLLGAALDYDHFAFAYARILDRAIPNLVAELNALT